MAEFVIGKREYTVEVDDDDLERVLEEGGWCPHEKETNIYVRKTVRVYCHSREKIIQKKIYLHRWLLNVEGKEILVDHRDRYGLNNRKENLRITDIAGNNKNRTYGMKANAKRIRGRI